MANTFIHKIEELANKSNWSVWKVDMKMLFINQGVWGIGSGVKSKLTDTPLAGDWTNKAIGSLPFIYFTCSKDI